MFKIVKYNNYYFKNKFIRSSINDYIYFKNIDDVKNYIKNLKLNYIENKKDVSIYESIQCVINKSDSDYKIFYKYIDINFKNEVSNV